MSPYLYVSIVTWLYLCGSCRCKWSEDIVDTSQSNWEFLTRFCFLSQDGRLDYEVWYPVGFGTQDLILYFDTPGQWNHVYDRGKTCQEQTSVLSTRSNQIISLNTSNTITSSHSGCSLLTYEGNTWYKCTGARLFKTTRERWWYLVLARCGQSKDRVPGLYARYKFHMTNGDDIWHKEYSADEFYILPVDISFLVLYLIMFVLSVVWAVKLRQRHMLHTTYKIFMFSLLLWVTSLVLRVTAWTKLGVSGWEWTSVDVAGRVFQGLSQSVFVLLLILLAKGYTVIRGTLTTPSCIRIAVFMTFYFMSTIVLYIWESKFFDAAKVLYYYESPPGYCMVSLQLIGWTWFLHAAIYTLKHTEFNTNFYMPFFCLYTLWFWSGPIMINIAMTSLPKWSREKTVNGVEQMVGFVGHFVFLMLTRPSAANSNFPYQIKTTQIDTISNDIKHSFELESHPFDEYQITSQGPNLDVFITQNSTDTDFISVENDDAVDDYSTIIVTASNNNNIDSDSNINNSSTNYNNLQQFPNPNQRNEVIDQERSRPGHSRTNESNFNNHDVLKDTTNETIQNSNNSSKNSNIHSQKTLTPNISHDRKVEMNRNKNDVTESVDNSGNNRKKTSWTDNTFNLGLLDQITSSSRLPPLPGGQQNLLQSLIPNTDNFNTHQTTSQNTPTKTPSTLFTAWDNKNMSKQYPTLSPLDVKTFSRNYGHDLQEPTAPSSSLPSSEDTTDRVSQNISHDTHRLAPLLMFTVTNSKKNDSESSRIQDNISASSLPVSRPFVNQPAFSSDNLTHKFDTSTSKNNHEFNNIRNKTNNGQLHDQNAINFSRHGNAKKNMDDVKMNTQKENGDEFNASHSNINLAPKSFRLIQKTSSHNPLPPETTSSFPHPVSKNPALAPQSSTDDI